MHTKTTNNRGLFLPLGINFYESSGRQSGWARQEAKKELRIGSYFSSARAEVMVRPCDPADFASGGLW